jgi:hypothetical protein
MKLKNYSLALALIACLVLMSLVVQTNGDVKVGVDNTAIYNDAVGRFGSATNWDFNTSANKGLAFEYGGSESGGFYVDGDYAVIWSPGDQGRLLRLYDEDNMQAGSTTFEKAYIDANGAYFQASDRRLKKDIASVSNAMSKINQISGVNYRFIKPAQANKADGENKVEKNNALSAGFIAQDIEKVMPELVGTDEFGNKFVNYEGMLPYLVEALKEQKATIDSLKVELRKGKR